MTSITPPFGEISGFIAVALSWLIAQSIKVIRGCIRERRFNFRWLFGTGGMPSAHSAAVASLETVVGLYYGFKSIPFLIVGVFMLITMFDAAGVRRSSGRQATVLNKMLDDLYERGEVTDARLKELLGHTPFEVFAGALLGVVVSVILCGVGT